MALSGVIAKRWKLSGDLTLESLRRLLPDFRAKVTSWKESDLATTTFCREAPSFSHQDSISDRISRNSSAANFARITIVFNAAKTPLPTFQAFTPRAMPAV